MSRLSVQVLGTPQVSVDGVVVAFPTRKALSLLLYLAVEPNSQPRSHLAVLFWPESGGERGRAALRRTVAYLRGALAAAGCQPDVPPLLTERDHLRLNPRLEVEVDLAIVADAWQAARSSANRTDISSAERQTLIEHLLVAVARYRGDFLDSFSLGDAPDFDAWAMVQREQWHRRMNLVFDRLSQYQWESGDLNGAAETIARWIASAPLNELAHRRRMLVLWTGGDRAAALHAYEECRALLLAEVNADPAPETDALARRVREEPPPSETATWMRVPERSRSAAPRLLTPLIGRDADVRVVTDLLTHDTVRMLTLLGPAGIGKTSLASHVAGLMDAHFADGVAFVALAQIAEPGLVGRAIAQALGIKEHRDVSLLDSLTYYLGDRHLLLVLDTFEHVLGAASLLAQLLAAAPGLTLLVTSRAALHVYGEVRWEVPPLPLPDLAPLNEAVDDVALLRQNPAVELFITRAQAIKPLFAPSPSDLGTIAETCVRLEGLPLAIELAAARSGLLSPRALLARLSNRLGVLTGGPRTLPARQQTMRDAIAWSYDLLAPQEQQLFRHLGVFVGGCMLDAVAAVAATTGVYARAVSSGDVDERSPALLDILGVLVDNSLLRQTPAADGEPRFVMLDMLREFALDRLAAHGEFEAATRRHALFYLALVETAEPSFEGVERQGQRRWLERLDAEHANLRAALAWCCTMPDGAAIGLGLAAALWQFWWVRGYLGEGRERLQQALAAAHMAGDVPDALIAKALNCLGFLATSQSDYTAAEAVHLQSRAIGERIGDERAVADAELGLANIASVLHLQHAQVLYQTSMQRFQHLGDHGSVAWILNGLGNLAQVASDYQTANTLFEQSLPLFAAIGDRRGSAYALLNMGRLQYELGDQARAQSLLDECLVLFDEIGDRGGMAYAYDWLGRVAHMGRDLVRARSFYETGLAMHREVGDKQAVARALSYLSTLARDQGDYFQSQQLRAASDALQGEIEGNP